MSIDQEEDLRDYVVVVNHEEQYSIWFVDREVPAGWTVVPIPEAWWDEYRASHQDAERINAKQVCLDYIETIWTDMRPLSLRRALGVA